MTDKQRENALDAVNERLRPANICQVAPQQSRHRRALRKVIEGQHRHGQFLDFCKQAAGNARARSKKIGVPCDIDVAYLESLLIEQKYRCAVAGIELELPPPPRGRARRRKPFGPSLDRIVPAKGYVRGNLRFTCCIVNIAMNEWGLDALLRVVDAMKGRRP